MDTDLLGLNFVSWQLASWLLGAGNMGKKVDGAKESLVPAESPKSDLPPKGDLARRKVKQQGYDKTRREKIRKLREDAQKTPDVEHLVAEKVAKRVAAIEASFQQKIKTCNASTAGRWRLLNEI